METEKSGGTNYDKNVTEAATPSSTDIIESKNVESTDLEPATDVEGKVKKLPYPKSVGFIISNEFCERFMYYGMRTILVLYLTRKLGYDDDTATILYHSFTTLVYFMCIFGAIISDSWLGKFNTILYLSIVYAIGSVVMSLGAIPPLNLPDRAMAFLGLALIALGSGGIKPCVAAFGGDQFKLPEQINQMATFFSLFYFSINAGSLISTTVTPILRQDVHCFEQNDCYSLAFGVPGALMVVSIVIFFVGKFMYIIRPPTGNMVVLVSKCIGNAISTKIKEKKTNPKEHWLDYAESKFGKQLVNDTKILLNVLVLFIPLPVFWALFDQQGSRWTFQATRMIGTVGSYEIKPDQLQVLNPLLILVFIPLYDVAFYPLLSKIGIRRPLQKLTLGGIFAGIAFLLSGFVELELEKTYPVIPGSGESQLRIFNLAQCDYRLETNIAESNNHVINSMNAFENKYVAVPNTYTYTFVPTGANSESCQTFTDNFQLAERTATSYVIRDSNVQHFDDDPNKSQTGDPVIRILFSTQSAREFSVIDLNRDDSVKFENFTNYNDRIELFASNYAILVEHTRTGEIDLKQGGVNTVLIRELTPTSFEFSTFEIAAPNSLHMFWLVPQYVIMTLGEVMYSVTGLAFSYAQAPESMKAVLQACWLLTVAFGNVIDIIVVGAKFFDSQAYEFFLFAGLMFVDMGFFMILAYRYKSLKLDDEQQSLLSDETAAIEDAKADDHKDITKAEGIDNDGFKKD